MERNHVHRGYCLHKETDNHTTQLSPRSTWGLSGDQTGVRPSVLLGPSLTVTQAACRMGSHLISWKQQT